MRSTSKCMYGKGLLNTIEVCRNVRDSFVLSAVIMLVHTVTPLFLLPDDMEACMEMNPGCRPIGLTRLRPWWAELA